MLQNIVENTNKYISTIITNYKRERAAKITDIIALKALLGLLYFAGTIASNRLNIKVMGYKGDRN